MGSVIPAGEIHRIRDQVSLADLVRENGVTLVAMGRTLRGRCPFCKAAKFNVNEERGFYHCFGCKRSGSAIDFVMEQRGFTFSEALGWLSQRVGR